MKFVMRYALIWLVVACSIASARALAQDATSTSRKQLSRHDLSIPGFEEYQVRVDFPKGTMAPNHRYPGEEIIYVIEGHIEYQLEGQAPVTLKAGDVLFVPARLRTARRTWARASA